MSSQSLVVPMVMWGRTAPTHCVSCLFMSPDFQHIASGCNDGQVILWNIDVQYQIRPRAMLFGHTAAITALASGSNHDSKSYIVSSSDNGEMALWDIQDGRCIEFTKYPFTHTNMQSYQLMHGRDIRLICNGYYPEIHIIHPLTLEVLLSLSSRIQPDWISALCILRPLKREDDVLVALSNSGTVKVWTLTGAETKASQPLYEDEAKHIRCLNAHTLRCCPYNQRTILIVCSKYWQIYDSNFIVRDRPKRDNDGIYDAGDFSLLCSESSRRGERWVGGDFIALDRIIVWSNEGKAYLYKLPTNLLRGRSVQSAIPGSPDYRRPANPQNPSQSGPQAYNSLDIAHEKTLSCAPAMLYYHGRRSAERKILLRGDSEGRLALWIIPDINNDRMKLVRQESFYRLPSIQPKVVVSLQQSWDAAAPKVEGIIDQLRDDDGAVLDITASIYIPSQGKLACGREDGSIVIVAAVYCLSIQLLKKEKIQDNLQHQILRGHKGRVNCLLYPYNDSMRYEQSLLISGGMDFSVILWDLSSGSQTHKFNVHAGEVSRLMTPPDTCNNRVLSCICSVASDHSLALLSVKELKPVLLASRQMFPILIVKWRPLDDFLIIGCTDGSVYVWQMETGHLDRVVNGVTAEEILSACDEKLIVTHDLTNPTLSIAQAFKRHNIATFKTFAHQRLHNQHDKSDKVSVHSSLMTRPDAHPMMIQGLRTNSKDPDSHVVLFDAEALIVQLLSEEFSMLSPATLQSCGVLVASENQSNIHLSDAEKKIAGFFAKVKDKAGDVGQKIQAKAESAGLKPAVSPSLSRKNSSTPQSPSTRPRHLKAPEQSLTIDIAQLFMSCLHAWGYDSDLDTLCINKLGLTRPKSAITFGVLSRGGYMSLLLPGWHSKYQQQTDLTLTRCHWQICRAVTTQHLMAVISVANTLMSINNSTFVPGVQDKQRVFNSGTGDELSDDGDDQTQIQSQSKQAWSLLAALHCVLLPELVGVDIYQAPMLEMLARRWQDRCLEIREAAQALLLAELRRIGQSGRKAIVDEWSAYLPSYVEPALSLMSETHDEHAEINGDHILEGDDVSEKSSQSFESRRRQAMAIVMMGVLGAEFGQEMEPSHAKKTTNDTHKKQRPVEGFEITNYSHARHTSNALTFLLQQPPSSKLPAYTPIRRAAIDLLGRGFTVWEPYLDVSAVLLGLLEMCVDADRLIPSMTFGLPLSPQADACRTARHALSLIATARPAALIITLAKEVARHNALLQSSHQMQHPQLNQSVLVRAKPEILHTLELLVDKIPNEVTDLLVEVMDITVHCLDASNIRNKGLQELFPAICRFSMVSFCTSSRRICVGAKNGSIAIYELKQAKCQILPAHKSPVTAVAFAPDAKFLASYSLKDNQLLFFQTGSTSMFGIGSQQTRCVKSYPVPAVNVTSNTNPLKVARIIWVDNRTVVVLTVDGRENKFRV